MKSISKSFIHQCLHFYRVMSAERNKQIRANSSLTINNRHRYKLSPIDKNWQNLYLLKEKMVAVLHGDRSDRFTQEVLQGVPPHAARPSAIVCWPVKSVNTNWRLRWGRESGYQGQFVKPSQCKRTT